MQVESAEQVQPMVDMARPMGQMSIHTWWWQISKKQQWFEDRLNNRITEPSTN